MNIFVSGGAGYIGSTYVEQALNAGHAVTVYDSLVEGHRSAIDPRANFVQADLSDGARILEALKAAKAPKAAPKQPPLRKGAVAAAPAGAETDVSESDGAAAAPSREAGKAAAAAIKAKAKAKAKEAMKHRVAGPVLTPGPFADAAVKASRAEFQRLLLLAVRSEDERFNACLGIGPDGKRLSRRADLVAFTALLNANGGVNQRPVVGHVPGIAIGVRFYGRAEVAAVGLHRHWLCGISYISKKESPYGAEVATSIVVSGGYEDDEDNGTDLTYTGQGGNDLLGRKKQLADQKWDRGNVAMRNAQQKGVPVRVIRANPDKQAPYGRVFIYDGLYDVIASEEKFGVSGCVSFAFLRCISRTTRHIKGRRADSTARWD